MPAIWPPKREGLLDFLGDRFGRKPFPDEIDRQVIKPIEKALKRVRHKEGFAGVFASLAFLGLQWSPGKSYCDLTLLLDPALRQRHRVSDDDVKAVENRLRKALNHFTRDRDYRVIATCMTSPKYRPRRRSRMTRSRSRSNSSSSTERATPAHTPAPTLVSP